MEGDLMNYNKYIEQFINQISLFSTSKKKIYFFKGFSKEFYDQLLLHQDFPRFSEHPIESIFNKDTEFKHYMVSLMMNDKTISWGTYEELIAISEVVPNLSLIYNGDIEIIHNNLYDGYFESYSDELFNTIRHLPSENADTVFDQFYSDYKLLHSGILVEYILKHHDNQLGLFITDRPFFDTGLELSDRPIENATKITESEINLIVYNAINDPSETHHYSVSSTKLNESNLKTRLSILNYVLQDSQVQFYVGKEKKIIKKQSEHHLPYFQKYWGSNSAYRNALFYKDPDVSLETIEINQGEIIDDILIQCENCRDGQSDVNNSSDVIVTAPTGSGKSLFFQVPGILLHEKYSEVTIVITPLQALMRDQVEKLQIERGVSFATYLNSEISFEERKSRIEGIHNGVYSIIYLSPELLLSSALEDFIGERRIGLFVIDEAHLVTSWGRDFRVDYWFLGEYLNKLREGHYYSKAIKRKFPVLILTATAIYGGEDDEIGELIESLHLNVDQTEHMYLGYSRKDNIHFDIVPHYKKGNEKDPKEDHVLSRLDQFIRNNKKTIIYCPYTKHVDEIYYLYYAKNEEYAKSIGRYHGKLTAQEKEDTYRKFKSNEITVMLATKAFGMGIDIDDIECVYHYAPTGTLADYVQEIGRAARQLDEGFAIMDYMVGKDTRFAKTLWGLGGIKQYQIKEIANILYKMHRKKNKRKLLISPETFSHIFNSNEVDAKVKSGLMLLTNDLLATSHFKAITIKPRAMYTSQYISLPKDIKDEFLNQYGKYVTPIKQANKTRKETSFGSAADVKITLLGDIYEINLGELWEEQFDSFTFPQFKYKFFKNELFDFKERVIPKMRLTIDYSSSSYEEVKRNFLSLANNIQNTFLSIARLKNLSEFKFSDFYEKFSSYYDEKYKPKKEFVRILLEMFCFDGVTPSASGQSLWKFVQRRKKPDSIDYDYKLVTKKYNNIAMNLKRYIQDVAPNSNDNTFTVFINIPDRGQENRDFKLLCATILQLFELATYEVQGGKNAQIFVQINDPYKLSQIAHSTHYRNNLLQAITKKHDQAINFLNQFLSQPFTDEERWDIIEHFFLGRNEVVQELLGNLAVENN